MTATCKIPYVYVTWNKQPGTKQRDAERDFREERLPCEYDPSGS